MDYGWNVMLICSFYFLQFVITSDLRCIYNNHINGRLQGDFGNVNGVNKDIGQEVNTYLCLPSTIRLYCWNWFCDTNMVSRISPYICWLHVLHTGLYVSAPLSIWAGYALLIIMMISTCSNATLNVFCVTIWLFCIENFVVVLPVKLSLRRSDSGVKFPKCIF